MLRLQDYSESLDFIKQRIIFLLNKGGRKSTALYLKESVRLFIRYLANQAECTYSGKGIIVKRSPNGIPHIIPSDLRLIISNKTRSETRYLCVCILSLLSIYRVINYKVIPNLHSITDEGKDKLPDINKYLRKITYGLFAHRVRLNLKSPDLIVLESTGPNAVKSAWSSSIDVLSFVNNFKLYIIYILFNIRNNSYLLPF